MAWLEVHTPHTLQILLLCSASSVCVAGSPVYSGMSETPLWIPCRIYRKEKRKVMKVTVNPRILKTSRHKNVTEETNILNQWKFMQTTHPFEVVSLCICFSYMWLSLLKSTCLISKSCGQTQYLNWVVDRYPGEQTPKGSSCWRRERLSFISRKASGTVEWCQALDASMNFSTCDIKTPAVRMEFSKPGEA